MSDSSSYISLPEKDWEILLGRIESKTCTPFIGAGASVPILPLGSQLAYEWAAKFKYPLSDPGDLAKVAQFVAVDMEDGIYPKEKIQEDFQKKSLPDFADIYQPHRLLADLELPIYLTSNYDNFMIEALKHLGKKPKLEICCWNDSIKSLKESAFSDEDFVPSHTTPVVYHLHGHIDWPQSMVLTEEDYLEFLVRFSSEKRLQFLPTDIRNAFAHSSLLFVGYSLADWNFRVLFRSVMEVLGGTRGRKSIAVQFKPPAIDNSEKALEKARAYLNKYYSHIHEKIKISVFWGEARDFSKELRSRLKTTGP
jgi:hypothetical protein